MACLTNLSNQPPRLSEWQPMRQIFDQFAKQMLKDALSSTGTVETEAEVVPEAKRVDVWYRPGEAREEARKKLGLLGEMTREPCIIEAYHRAPTLGEFKACVVKQIVFASKKRKDREAGSAFLWIVSAGRPRALLRSFVWYTQMQDVSGVYRLQGNFGIGLVVVPQLPKERSTLLLRLLGAGLAFKAALEELSSLPAEAPERKFIVRALTQARFAIETIAPEKRTQEEMVMKRGQAEFEAFERNAIGGFNRS